MFKTQQFDLLRDSPSKTFGSDFNGDGIHDILVGTNLFDIAPTVIDSSGAAYIVFGTRTLSGTKNFSTSSPDVTFIGAGSDSQLADPQGLASAGDINGDGIDDVIAGAFSNDRGANNSGAAFIFFGSTGWNNTTLDVSSLISSSTSDVTFLGKAANDYFGNAVAGIGDVNGDGLDDLAVGANQNDDTADNNGAVYVFFGSTTLNGKSIDLSGSGQADMTFSGRAENDNLGRSVSGAGDLNNDGLADIIMGAPRNDDCGGSGECGTIYVKFGNPNLTGTFSVVNGSDLTIVGNQAGAELGRSTGRVTR